MKFTSRSRALPGRFLIAIVLVVLILSGCLMPQGSVDPVPTSQDRGPTDEISGSTQPTLTVTLTPAAATRQPEVTESDSQAPGQVITASNVMSLEEAGSVQAEAGAQVFAWVGEAPDLALAQSEAVVVFNLTGISTTEEISTTAPTLLTTASDQNLVAWTAEDTIHVWDLEESREPTPAFQSFEPVTGLVIAPQGDTLIYATSDNQLITHDVGAGKNTQSWELPFWLTSLAYSPDGKQVAGVEAGSFRLHFFDAETGKEQRVLEWTDTASPVLYGVFFSPDWTKVAWVARGTVQIMDVAAGTLGPTLGHEDFINAITWSPDGSLLATAAAGTVNGEFTPLVTVWETAGGTEAAKLPQPEPTLNLSFSPDGRSLATLYASGKIQLWAVN